jgi:hypothetical protein
MKVFSQRKVFMSSLVIINCPKTECTARLRIPTDKGKLRVTCPKCGTCFEYQPSSLADFEVVGSSLNESVPATPEMIAKFVDMLQEWDLAPEAREVLIKLGWEPTTDDERIYWALATGSAPEIMRLANSAQELLLSNAASGDLRKIKTAVYGLIFIGREYTSFSGLRVVDQLIAVLNSQGTKEMAKIYVNCGHHELEEAAHAWATKNGYRFVRVPGRPELRWGHENS